MRANGPAYFLVHIGFDHLGTPIAVIAPDEACHCDIVQQAGQDDLLAVAGPFGQ
jgi:hypothetical protein